MQKLFDVRKYQNENSTLVDGSDALANKKELVISFYHEPSGRSVFFKAFITAFTETYNSNFTPHEAFGRTDPIYQYKNTTRKISLTFEVPAASEGEAYENLGRVSALEQMLYASYAGDPNNALNITQAPLIRLKVMNLLQKQSLGSTGGATTPQGGGGAGSNIEDKKETFQIYSSTSDSSRGLLGIIDNLSVNHNIAGDDSVFHKTKVETDPETQKSKLVGVPNTILPKNIELSLGFSPIHETTLGWQGEKQINSLFPYNVVTEQTDQKGNGTAANPLVAYKEEVAKQKAEEEKRKLRQQNIDNAKARYSGMLGGMRMKSDIRRSVRGNEKANQRLQNYTNAAFDEGLMEAGYANEEELNEFIQGITE